MWQALHAELEPLGVTVVTVALDFDPDKARPFIERANPTHPSLIDPAHRIDELLGISNVPMAVWIDESGNLVRPAEAASIKASKYRAMEVSDDWPEPMKQVIRGLQAVPDTGEAYRAAIIDWTANGASSPFAMSPADVIAASQPRSVEHSRAAACFALGRYLYESGNKDAAIPWWKEAHTLYPDNWTYKRQAWTLESTAEGEESDMAQDVQAVYGTSWSEAFLASGGGATYSITPSL